MVTALALTNSPNQKFKTTIPGDNRNLNLNLTLSYNTIAGYWVLGVYDEAKSPVVLNVPLMIGRDLFEQYQYLNIGSAYLINMGDAALVPDDVSIGNFVLQWELV